MTIETIQQTKKTLDAEALAEQEKSNLMVQMCEDAFAPFAAVIKAVIPNLKKDMIQYPTVKASSFEYYYPRGSYCNWYASCSNNHTIEWGMYINVSGYSNRESYTKDQFDVELTKALAMALV